jgi:hypothetical protein
VTSGSVTVEEDWVQMTENSQVRGARCGCGCGCGIGLTEDSVRVLGRQEAHGAGTGAGGDFGLRRP